MAGHKRKGMKAKGMTKGGAMKAKAMMRGGAMRTKGGMMGGKKTTAKPGGMKNDRDWETTQLLL